MNNKKGFLTIAIGKYFYNLAENLIMTYRLNTKNISPFYIVTDNDGKYLRRYYDGIIIANDKIESNLLYKLNIYDYSPFGKTIFIDVDSFVIRDIDFLWDLFSDTSCDVSVLGRNDPVEKVSHFFSEKATKLYRFNEYPVFNGGVYYFKKTQLAKAVFDTAKLLIDSYYDLGMPSFGIRKGDEPLMALAMAKYNMKATLNKNSCGMICAFNASSLKVDTINKKCSMIKYGKLVKPSILHFGTNNTLKPLYICEAIRIKKYYFKRNLSLYEILDYKLKINLYLKWCQYYFRIVWSEKGNFIRMILKLIKSLFQMSTP